MWFLPLPDSPTTATTSAGLNIQRHAVYSMYRLTAKEPFTDVEMHFDIMELNQL